jgi:hypothetical protein
VVLLTLLYTPSCAGENGVCPSLPGKPPLNYVDGSFSIPSPIVPAYTTGTKLNITWSTKFQFSTLWLITGCNFESPTASLAVGTTARFFEWTVSTTSTNSSQIYLFRVVNTVGDAASQMVEGFLSSSFQISGGPTSTLQPATSTLLSSSTPAYSSITVASRAVESSGMFI